VKKQTVIMKGAYQKRSPAFLHPK